MQPLLCGSLREATTSHPRVALRAIDATSLSAREPVYACFDDTSPEQARRLADSLRGAAGTAPFVESELRQRLPAVEEQRS